MGQALAVSTSCTYPHSSNFCGGNFQDWLEVNLLPECNARCQWCIEKKGYHPSHRASWEEIGQAAINTGKKNIILLGGEPTLYKNLKQLIQFLISENRNVWITTNGFLLDRKLDDINGIAGINISVHHFDLNKNREITGLILQEEKLKNVISVLHLNTASVRLNCNLIPGYIDSEGKIYRYIDFAKRINVDNIRFAELKTSDSFVDLAAIFGSRFGINTDPFIHGCNKDAVINGIPVNFRQMCGLQTKYRHLPINPVQYSKEVLYYDGNIYQGWQASGGLDTLAIKNILSEVSNGSLSINEAFQFF